MISSRSGLHEAKSIHYRGDFMNGLKGTGCRALASMAMLSGAIFTLLLVPAYGQQDVNPDWYDPAPSVAAVHPVQPASVAQSSQLPVATHRLQQTAKSASPAVNTGKARVKDARLDQSGHNATRKSGGAMSEGLVACSEPMALNAKARECPAMDDRRVASVEAPAQLDPVVHR
jgi:hypothetical protein